ncbi:hypothetical protein MBRA1_001748 [Malassezia brasiliensis]|uniref:AAA+ ATPase domain-containing protein n=1 Tax=Malassezia brasiliensis TaxID=1821822 RepID=A0AAF0DS01_9BASI|nr:hypothetical protein MBRA1_001748 [Malassezia brasiliensis]
MNTVGLEDASDVVHVEVRQRYDSLRDEEDVRREVAQLVAHKGAYTTERGLDVSNTDLLDDVERVYVAESAPESHIGRRMGNVRAICSQFSLVYNDDVKARLLHYIYTTMQFAASGIDANIITCNRMVLLHGPPGTGKTTLSRALAQKLAIRLSAQYTHGKLVEINSHSLFSKWFSESGKLVHRLFELINELLADETGFVVVLIDEIESLTKARASAAAGVEPSDSIRVVNALLTELDKLKHKQNVLVMTTSNLSETIDAAFLDRADIRQYIGLPGSEAVYRILGSCLSELMRVRLAQPEPIVPYQDARMASGASAALLDLADACRGASGRSLRRLPVLAHARHLASCTQPSALDWIHALHKAWVEMQGEATQASS